MIKMTKRLLIMLTISIMLASSSIGAYAGANHMAPTPTSSLGSEFILSKMSTQNNIEYINVTVTGYKISGLDFVQGSEHKGTISQEVNGVKMIGDTHTNGRLVNGKRDGNSIYSVNSYDLKNKTIYGAFTVYGSNYCAYTGFGVDKVGSGGYVTTHHSWAGSKVVKSGTKIFKTLTFTDTTWKMTFATGNYHGKTGSVLLQEKTGNLSDVAKQNINSPQKIYFIFGDNYGGTSSYMVANELFIQ